MTEHEKHTNASASPLRRLLKAFGIGKEHGRERARSEQLRSESRRAEAGNVFFTLFGAVAIVGVLGAGIMSTMRGPLTTMVEVNRIEEAKSVIRLNSRLVLQNATRGDSALATTPPASAYCDDDDFTEAPDPVTATDGIADGGTLPTNVGATLTDPWGTPYGYCSWNHGPDPNTCTNTIDGENSTTEVTIAIVSAGPDREFTTECGDLYNGDALNDDIATRVPYNDAAAMAGGGTSGGLWSDMGTSAEIGKDLTVTSAGTSAFTGGATFGNDLVTSGTLITNNIQSLDPSDTISISATSTNFDSDLVVNGTNTTTLNGATTINDDLTVTGNTRVQALDVGGDITDSSDGLVSVNSALNVTGAGDFDSTLNVDGIANFESTITSDGDGVVNIDDDLGITGDIVTDVVINSTTADGSTNPLTLYQSDGTTEVFAVDSSGNTDIAGNLAVNTDKFTVDASNGDTIVGGDLTITGDNFSLGTTADNGNGKIMIGQGAPDNNFAAKSVTGDVTLDKDGDIQIKAGVVDTNELADGAVTNIKIADGAVDTDELADGAVDENKIKATNTAGSDECLKFDGTDLEWGDCYTTGGGGDGVGLDGIGDLSDVVITSVAADQCLVYNGTDSEWQNVACSTIVGAEPSRIIDATSPTDTYIDVDTADPDDGLNNSTVFVNNGAESMRILANGNIGIGKADPTSRLTLLDGNFSIREDDDGNDAVLIGAGNTTGSMLMNLDGTTNVLLTSAVTTASYFNSGSVVFGGTTADASARVQIDSTSQGFLPPRMTETERNAIATPATGLLVFNTDAGDASTGLLQFWDGTQWVDVGGGGAETGGLWAEDDAGGNFIEYDNDLGGMRVGRIDGQDAPAIDWTLDVANSLVYTDHAVGIGVSSISDDSGSNPNVMLDLSGDIAALEYCDTSGANCFTAGDIGSLSAGANLWTDNTQYITRETFHILNAGETMTSAGFDSASFNGLVFHPDKRALRFGSNGFSAWNEANIGLNSFAGGAYTIASGEESFAFGKYLDVTGDGSVALSGDNDTIVSGNNSFAFGGNLNINGIDNHAWGDDLDVAGSTQDTMTFKLGNGASTAPLIDNGADSTFNVLLGPQDSVVLNTPNQISFFGGNLLIDPADPATQLVARGAIDVGAATDAIVLPSGTTGERPGTGVDGMLRFNSDNDAYEVYSSTAGDWVEIVSGGTPGLWTDLGGDRIHYGNDGDDVQVGIGTNNPVTTLDVNGGVRVGSVSAAPPAYLALNSLTDVDTSPSDGECLIYDTGSGNWENGACDDASNALWTDNTTHITRENFHILDTGETMTSAGFDNTIGNAFVWYPDKQALRAGSSGGATKWNEAEIGTKSFVMGNNSRATKDNSFAFGHYVDATGQYSVGMGNDADALADGSSAIGRILEASGTWSHARGNKATVSGTNSWAFGLADAAGPAFPTVSGNSSFGIFMGDQTGVDVTASNVMAIMGGQVGIGTADPQATLDVNGGIRMEGVSGGEPTASGGLWTDNTTHISRESIYILNTGETPNTAGLTGPGTAMFWYPDKRAFRVGLYGSGGSGYLNDAGIGMNSFAFGHQNEASGTSSMAGGYQSDANGGTSLAFGDQVAANGAASVAIGRAVRATGAYSFAFGLGGQPGSSNTVSGSKSLGIFIGDQGGYDLTTNNRMALVGGDFMIDDDGTAGSQGCIRYVEGTGLQYSNDCSSYSPFGGSGLWTTDDGGANIYNADNGNVGVGTAFPQADFDVTDLLLDQGTGNCPADYTEGDYDGEADSADCRMVGLTVNKTNGHVGIGTTPSSYVLNVDGDGNNGDLIRVGNFGTRFTVRSPGGNGRIDIHNGAQNSEVSLGANGNSYINTNLGLDDSSPDAKLEISANGSTTGNAFLISSDDDNDGDILTVTNGGQVGIGTDTPETEAMLHIVNNTPASSSSNATGLVIDTNTGGSSFGNALQVNDDQLVVGNSWGTPEVSIGGAGNDTPLTVAGRTGTGIGDILSILPTNSNTASDPGDGARMLFRGYDDSYNRKSYAGIAGLVTQTTAADLEGALVFYSVDGNSLNEVGRFDAQGDFGIGVTDPQAKLDVDGDIQYTGTLTDISDKRLKTDITPLSAEDMIARLSAVDTYSFRMKDDEKGRIEFGVMAQELEEIFPELVNTAEDEMGTKSVNYTGLIAPMIEATKALRSENEALKAELDAVKQQQQKVLASLESMQNDINGMKVHTGYGIEKGSAIAMLLLLLSLGGITATILVQRQKSATPTERT